MKKIFILSLFFVYNFFAISQNVDTLIAKKGDTLAISFVDNPSTGYGWYLDSFNKCKLVFLKSEFKPGAEGLIGEAGTRLFYFITIKSGKAKVIFVKKRFNEIFIEKKKFVIIIEKN